MKKYFLTLLIPFFMVEVSTAQKTPEEIEVEKQANIAKQKAEIAKAEFEVAKAKKDAENLNAPADEKAQAEKEKAIAEANKAAIQAKRDIYKGPEITPPTGKITSDGVFIESKILTQKALHTNLSKLALKIKNSTVFPDGTSFVIYNQVDVPLLELYASMMDQTKTMESAYKKNSKDADVLLTTHKSIPAAGSKSGDILAADPLLVGYAAAGVLRTAADIVSLFKTTTEYKNFDITIDENALTASLNNALTTVNPKWKVYNPAILPINTIKNPLGKSAFIDVMNDIETAKGKAESKLKDLEQQIEQFKKEVEDEKNPAEKKRKKDFVEKLIKKAEPIFSSFKTLNTTFSQLQNTLSTADATTKITGQALIMRAERLFNKLGQKDVYLIRINTYSKGSNKVTDNLWRNSKIKHSGGTEVNCTIYGPEGDIVFSYSAIEYTPYLSPDEIKEL